MGEELKLLTVPSDSPHGFGWPVLLCKMKGWSEASGLWELGAAVRLHRKQGAHGRAEPSPLHPTPPLQPVQLYSHLYIGWDLFRFYGEGVPGNGRPSTVGLSRPTPSSIVPLLLCQIFLTSSSLTPSLSSGKCSLPLLSATPAHFSLASAPPPHIPLTSVSLNPFCSFRFSLLVTSAFLKTSPFHSLTLSPLGSLPAPLAIWSSSHCPLVMSFGSGGGWILAVPAPGCWGPSLTPGLPPAHTLDLLIPSLLSAEASRPAASKALSQPGFCPPSDSFFCLLLPVSPGQPIPLF